MVEKPGVEEIIVEKWILGLKCPQVEELYIVKEFMVEEFMVKEFMVEEFMVEKFMA